MKENRLNEIEKDVLQEIRTDRLIELATSICDVHSPTGEEAEVARLLQSLMESIGMRTQLQEVEEGRLNVVGMLEGTGAGQTLMFDGHLDTSFPFLLGQGEGILERHLRSEVNGEWLYGTGIANMKGGFACYLAAVEAIQQSKIQLAGDIIITGDVGEVEAAQVSQYKGRAYRGHGHGIRHLITHGLLADFCVLGEPTNMKIHLGLCGTVWVKITTRGPIMGAYRSDWKDNPINRAMRLIEALQSWRVSFIERHRHRGINAGVAISAIEGGWPWRAARTPGSCSIYVDVRTAPDQALISVKRELMPLIRSFDPEDPRYRSEVEFYATIPGSEISPDKAIVQAVQRAHTTLHGQAAAYGFQSPVDHANHLNRYGIPTVIYGPGGARRTDGKGPTNEYVRIENLVSCAKVYAATALDVCGPPTIP